MAKHTKNSENPAVIQVPVVVLTVETLMKLMERMSALEKRMADEESERQSNFDYWVEHLPALTPNGLRIMVAPESASADLAWVTVPMSPGSFTELVDK